MRRPWVWRPWGVWRCRLVVGWSRRHRVFGVVEGRAAGEGGLAEDVADVGF